MKWNKRAKLTATATSALLFTLLLASCANNNNEIPLPVNNQVQQEQTENNDNNQVELDEDTNAAEEPITDTEENNNTDSDQDETIYEATGTYVGAIDNNSIEVTIDGQATVFQLTEAFHYIINDFKEQTNVVIKYNKRTTEDGNYEKKIITDIIETK